MPIFAALAVYQDDLPRSAAMNMAIDEALLESSKIPSLRFYRWDHAALSFGYFGRFADVSEYQAKRDLVRRWTGGGIVFHGEDLTYSIVIPRADSSFRESPLALYAAVHEALREVFVAGGERAELATVAAVSDRRSQMISAVGDRRYSKDACFANPVSADVLLNGKKVAGAAQRRSRLGLLQQGSIQHVDMADDFGCRFAEELSGDVRSPHLGQNILDRAGILAAQKYGSEDWLHRR